MSRQYTQEEMREMFLEHLVVIAKYWIREARAVTAEDKVAGAIFSVLSMLDGCSIGAPAFVIYPAPHPEDQAYHQEEGENWWQPEPTVPEGVKDIHGDHMLHEMWHKAFKGLSDLFNQHVSAVEELKKLYTDPKAGGVFVDGRLSSVVVPVDLVKKIIGKE